MTEKQINTVKQIVRYADITEDERKRWCWTLGYPLLNADREITKTEASAFIGQYIEEAAIKYREYKFQKKINAASRYKTMFDYCD